MVMSPAGKRDQASAVLTHCYLLSVKIMQIVFVIVEKLWLHRPLTDWCGA